MPTFTPGMQMIPGMTPNMLGLMPGMMSPAAMQVSHPHHSHCQKPRQLRVRTKLLPVASASVS